MSFEQFIATLKARKLLFAIVFLSTVVLVTAISFILPKKYTGSAAVVIDVKSPDPIAGMILPGMVAPGYMTTQLEVLKSDRVMRMVIAKMHLSEIQQVKDDWMDATDGEGDLVSWLAEALQRNLDIIPLKDSNVINVSYTARDPKFAAAMANAFVKAYIETTLELKTEPARQYSSMFEVQAKSIKDNLEAARTKLSEFQKANGIVDTDERFDVETGRLNELSTALVTAQALSAESVSRKTQAGANATEVLNNPVVANLKASLALQEAHYRELSAKYGPAYPLVQEAQANANELRAKLEVESNRVSTSLGINNTVNLSREAQLKIALEQQRQKLLKMKELRDRAAVLAKDVDDAQHAYDAVQARFIQTNLESQITQTNVSQLRVAMPPATYSSPKILINIIVSVFLGASLAVGACMFKESMDKRLRTDSDVIDRLGLPLLAVIPRSDAEAPSLPSPKKNKAIAHRALPELPGPAR